MPLGLGIMIKIIFSVAARCGGKAHAMVKYTSREAAVSRFQAIKASEKRFATDIAAIKRNNPALSDKQARAIALSRKAKGYI